MTLPALIDYATPRHTPTNRVNWTLDPSRAAVLVHDLQRYFFRAFAPGCPALERALAATAEILAAARAAGVPVFYTAQTGDQSTDERGLQGELWGRGMTSAPEDTAIVDAVAPHAGDQTDPSAAFLRLWVRKEALVKAGFGSLNDPLSLDALTPPVPVTDWTDGRAVGAFAHAAS